MVYLELVLLLLEYHKKNDLKDTVESSDLPSPLAPKSMTLKTVETWALTPIDVKYVKATLRTMMKVSCKRDGRIFISNKWFIQNRRTFV